MARVNPQTYNSIKGLTDDRNTVVVIFSGSGMVTFDPKAGAERPGLANPE